ncbi:MAG: HAD family phosphatase [Clostridia bacterium]|nr:HAD family phosphatase [Clostridia bacterium]
MKKYKILVCDYDGTLINSNYVITPNTLSAINGFIDRGGTLVVCTGRMTSGINNHVLKFGLKPIIASFNGAEIFDLKSGKVYFCKHIDNKTSISIIRFLEGLNLKVNAYSNYNYISSASDEKVARYSLATGVEAIRVKSVADYLESSKESTAKIAVLDDVEIINKYFEIIKNQFPEFDVVRSTREQIDICLKGISKGSAISYIANLLNASVEDVLAVGDADNDESMLKTAGFSVAMGNAFSRIKSICDYVTSSNEDDGIKEVIDKFCI